MIDNRTIIVSFFIFATFLLAAKKDFAQMTFETASFSSEFDIRIDVENCDSYACEGTGVFSIFRKGKKTPFQIIRLDETVIHRDKTDKLQLTDIVDKKNGNWSSVYLEDFNFDGLKDLAIPDGRNGGYNGVSYRIYLFDRSRDRFVYSIPFTRLAQGPYIGIPKINIKTKTLEVFWKSGAGFHSIERHSVSGNRPRKIYEYSEDSMLNDGNRYITTKKLINGKWRIWNKTIKEASQ